LTTRKTVIKSNNNLSNYVTADNSQRTLESKGWSYFSLCRLCFRCDINYGCYRRSLARAWSVRHKMTSLYSVLIPIISKLIPVSRVTGFYARKQLDCFSAS